MSGSRRSNAFDEDRGLSIVIHTSGLEISGEDPVDLSLGGAETAVVSMARALARQGHELTVFCNTPSRRRRGGVSWLPEGDLQALLGQRSDVFLSCRYPEILTHDVRATHIGLWHHDPPCEDRVAALRRILSRTSFSLFLSRFQERVYEDFLPGIADRAIRTTNGVDFDAVDAIRRKASPPETPRFVYASRATRGLDFLLEAIWPAIRERHPRAELAVTAYDHTRMPAGDPQMARQREPWREIAAMLPPDAGVSWIGPLSRRRFWQTLARSTAVLYPTDCPEISCMVALEAQALGVPIVTTDDFALHENVAFAATRVPLPLRSATYVERFLQTVFRLLEDPAFYAAARRAGEELVTRERFSWDAIARRWAVEFDRLMVDRRRERRAASGCRPPVAPPE